jgi:hypothetical protein
VPPAAAPVGRHRRRLGVFTSSPPCGGVRRQCRSCDADPAGVAPARSWRGTVPPRRVCKEAAHAKTHDRGGGPAHALLAPSPALAIDEVDTQRLRNAVTVGGILAHQRVFQRIANNHDGTRASGTPGYDASAAYVAQRLKAAGYDVTVQEFDCNFFDELAPAELEQTSPTPTTYETGTFDYSGSGEVTGQLFAANNLVIPPTPAPTSTR